MKCIPCTSIINCFQLQAFVINDQAVKTMVINNEGFWVQIQFFTVGYTRKYTEELSKAIYRQQIYV